MQPGSSSFNIFWSLPEIQTLLDGITVGGHKVNDQQIALNQADTWRVLFDLIAPPPAKAGTNPISNVDLRPNFGIFKAWYDGAK